MTIHVSQTIIAQIIAQAEQAYPEECCGFILGELDRQNESISHSHYYLPCLNEKSDNRERRFLIDPIAYQDAEDQADREGLAIISIVHSHPDHPDSPSEFDRLHAWPGLSYIIISVHQHKAAGYRSWRLTEDRQRFDPEQVCVDGSDTKASI
ncbi:Mov34/MPN/PAD-1 family protein [Photobacterium atrarenae]|uniref:M67 family metallopeptidase n=1 Tax=Photobacterium atrarenae TaxID=865757 RepID=A0ABY5GKK8_9GAMM|nr:M67 family metallopeptidase [Photobacterium atrarenae]UTV29067.1 M67 family metallopeptidase [Photobacterium atrarenae]